MKMKHSTEFTSYDTEFSYDEFKKIWDAVQSAGPDCTVSIKQTTYNEGPYGTTTTTYIEIEAS